MTTQQATPLTVSFWTTPSQSTGVSPIDLLWNRLDGLFPARWRSAFPDSQSTTNWRAAWTEALVEECITLAELKTGLKACRTGGRKWPPSLAEFIELCRPPIDPETAFLAAVEGLQARERGQVGQWQHPAIYWAAVRVGSYDVMSSRWESIRSRWCAALSDELARGRWDDIPEPAPMLEAPAKISVPPEEQRRRINALLGILVGSIRADR